MSELNQMFHRRLHSAARVYAEDGKVLFRLADIQKDGRDAAGRDKLASGIVVFRGNDGESGDARAE